MFRWFFAAVLACVLLPQPILASNANIIEFAQYLGTKTKDPDIVALTKIVTAEALVEENPTASFKLYKEMMPSVLGQAMMEDLTGKQKSAVKAILPKMILLADQLFAVEIVSHSANQIQLKELAKELPHDPAKLRKDLMQLNVDMIKILNMVREDDRTSTMLSDVQEYLGEDVNDIILICANAWRTIGSMDEANLFLAQAYQGGIVDETKESLPFFMSSVGFYAILIDPGLSKKAFDFADNNCEAKYRKAFDDSRQSAVYLSGLVSSGAATGITEDYERPAPLWYSCAVMSAKIPSEEDQVRIIAHAKQFVTAKSWPNDTIGLDIVPSLINWGKKKEADDIIDIAMKNNIGMADISAVLLSPMVDKEKGEKNIVAFFTEFLSRRGNEDIALPSLRRCLNLVVRMNRGQISLTAESFAKIRQAFDLKFKKAEYKAEFYNAFRSCVDDKTKVEVDQVVDDCLKLIKDNPEQKNMLLANLVAANVGPDNERAKYLALQLSGDKETMAIAMEHICGNLSLQITNPMTSIRILRKFSPGN
ncbi:MAG: hypothetical protein NTW50_05580 [Candidatus Berkelbacteria bacterium]|nr:hypothetical protein [Candidatus Berkelbacteria bacterium]